MPKPVPDLTAFRVHGLHGRLDIEVPIRDNKVVLVGVNGLGKTTFINLLYFFLTKQWQRLLQYPFQKIALIAGPKTIEITQAELESHIEHLLRRNRHYPPSLRRRIESDPEARRLLALAEESPRSVERAARYLGMPIHFVRDIVSHQGRLFEDEPGPLAECASQLAEVVGGQVLYLPTYRRIERDLKAIFPGMEEDIEQYRRQRRRGRHAPERNFVEFVEFGMTDVEELFSITLSALKDDARSELNRLGFGYLRDVIRGAASAYDQTIIMNLRDKDVERILSRVEEETLTDDDKSSLRKAIARLQSLKGDTPEVEDHDRYVGHFFSKLVGIHASLSAKEQAVSAFVGVCNEYLDGKSLVFDDRQYEIRTTMTDGEPIELSDLSSGEKQIVSLFSHIYLGGDSGLTVLIDEPELSLSVEWQRRLLPDIAAAPRCEGLVAVTHSPFIFDNDMDDYVLDMRTCISRHEPS